MAKLSVNVNKVATIRNSRGGAIPSVVDAARVCIEAGAPGITVHPRSDARHITFKDVHELKDLLEPWKNVEFNIEGDPRPDLLNLVETVRPHQCTLVPVRPGEITSEAGWPPDTDEKDLRDVIARLRGFGIRVSLFIDATEAAVRLAERVGADRVELYTEPYARGFNTKGVSLDDALAPYVRAAGLAADLGMGVNAGHDLDLENLPDLVGALPRLDEVSIGHALISYALYVGLRQAVLEYREAAGDTI
ncbi:pyridoxine 5'-phosphate synthase [Luteitalea sp. TBR-22]|uniref:pyridoxine 5'-phosphate synthase n=1 Tax=Luteitalea sp. TBR-22 TaxID=2802971 RepID=UPI001AF68368|nr:pyridoxine 5'-phosphate synthase [Luteitalea sp. TBR-22]BCS31477.1 pyridoxine 5'-phosphate synthase [Luteitalea sp. TBR-22]